jgi:hypothetical protein
MPVSAWITLQAVGPGCLWLRRGKPRHLVRLVIEQFLQLGDF